MTETEIDIAPAGPADIDGILDLQTRNMADVGGLLTDAYTRARLERDMAAMPAFVALRGDRVVGYVLSGSRAAKIGVPIMEAMMRAYPGEPDAYMYGPICVDEGERRHGVARRLYLALAAALPGREGLTFIRADNVASLAAHGRLGFREVGTFAFGGLRNVILSDRAG